MTTGETTSAAEAAHAPWCKTSHDGLQCFRDTSWPSDPIQVSLVYQRDRQDMFVLVMRKGMPAAGLTLPNAQAISAMLAFTAPSPKTAAFGIALQRAAGMGFRLTGLPEVGPGEGAINPWEPDRG